MKNILKYTFFVAAGLLMASCDDGLKELNKGEDTLTLTTDSALVLNEVAASEDGLVLEWSSGSNHQTGNRIYYRLELAKQGDSYDNGYIAVNGATQTYSWKKNVEETNDLMLNTFGAAEGGTVHMMARVVAYGEGFEEQMAESFFDVTTYKPVSKELYLIGSATPAGWTLENAVALKREAPGKFKWEGTLSAGEFKFLCSNSAWTPSYNKDEAGLPVLRNDDSEPDEKWVIEESAYYVVQVNILNPAISLKKQEGAKPRFDELFLIGNETDWNFWPMDRDLLDSYLFRIGHVWTKGADFKFGTTSGDWQNNYKAPYADAPYTEQSMEFVTGYDPDNKWVLKAEELGAYKICVDIREGQERMMMTPFVPYEMIYMIGSATASGWDIGNAVAMTKVDDYTFTYTGALSAGELKFTCDKKGDWMGAWFLASEENMTPTGTEERMLFVDKSNDTFKAQYIDANINDVDRKWNVEAGNYSITLNQLTETITIIKQ